MTDSRPDGSPDPALVFFCESRVMIDLRRRRPCRLDRAQAGELLNQARASVRLEDASGRLLEAVAIERFRPRQRIPDADFEPLRGIAAELDSESWQLLARSHSLLEWQRAHRYCGSCGHPTEALDGGHRRRCSNRDCGRLDFPRTDPAVIMRITHEDRLLLGRQPTWPEQRRSVLAGFVHPGESAEEAVVREVHEESGIQVDPASLSWFGSQHWPFPGSLMLAFTARAQGGEPHPRDGELARVDWWTRTELKAALEADRIALPGQRSVARTLIDEWIKGDGLHDNGLTQGRNNR